MVAFNPLASFDFTSYLGLSGSSSWAITAQMTSMVVMVEIPWLMNLATLRFEDAIIEITGYSGNLSNMAIA